MPIPSKIHAQELRRISEESYVNQTFPCALVDAPGSDFGPDDAFASVMANEVQTGLGGYGRSQIGFVQGDIGTYEDGSLPMARKSVIFEHDGTINQIIRFSHVVLLAPSESQILCMAKLASRAALSDGQSAIFYFDFTLYGVYVADDLG